MTDFESPEKTPGVRQMLYLIPPPLALSNGNQVEPIQILRSAVPQAPHLSEPADDDSLAPAYRLGRRAAGDRATRLHFDEGHDSSAPRDEIEIVPAPAVAVRLDIPATSRQEGQRGALAR